MLRRTRLTLGPVRYSIWRQLDGLAAQNKGTLGTVLVPRALGQLRLYRLELRCEPYLSFGCKFLSMFNFRPQALSVRFTSVIVIDYQRCRSAGAAGRYGWWSPLPAQRDSVRMH